MLLLFLQNPFGPLMASLPRHLCKYLIKPRELGAPGGEACLLLPERSWEIDNTADVRKQGGQDAQVGRRCHSGLFG